MKGRISRKWNTVKKRKKLYKNSEIMKKEYEKRRKAKVCIGCENNHEGYCYKYKGWCSRNNHKCN